MVTGFTAVPTVTDCSSIPALAPFTVTSKSPVKPASTDTGTLNVIVSFAAVA